MEFSLSVRNPNTQKQLEVKRLDTLKVYRNGEHKYNETVTVFNHFTLIEDEAKKQYRLDKGIRLNINQSKGETVEMNIEKNARGWSQNLARENAKAIEYNFDYYDHQLILDGC